MALKDHSLDDKITAAAKAKFLDTGYTGASLRKIAEHVGVTAPCRFIDSGRSARGPLHGSRLFHPGRLP